MTFCFAGFYLTYTSDINAISAELFSLLNRTPEAANIALRGANNQPIKVVGNTNVILSAFGRQLQISVTVIEGLPVPLLIGSPVMRKHRININFGNHTITKMTKQNKIQSSINMVKASSKMSPVEDEPPKKEFHRMVTASADTTIPPLHEQIVSATIKGKTKMNGTFLVKGPTHTFKSTRIARGISNVKDSNLLLVIANFTNSPIKITKGQARGSDTTN